MKTFVSALKKSWWIFVSAVFIIAASVSASVWVKLSTDETNDETPTDETQLEPTEFSFVLISDQREFAGEGTYDSSEYFAGALQKIATLDTDFMIVVGDLDPVAKTSYSIQKYLGTNYDWYAVVGNHELPAQGTEAYLGENMELMRAFQYDNSNEGPATCPTTTYSFDFETAHFAVLNIYCDDISDVNTPGKISDTLFDWLKADIESSDKELKFVIGHEPAYPKPDAESARERHYGDSLDQFPEERDAFWAYLVESNIDAYFCGHTHNFSQVEIDGVTQVDAGHARGIADLGAKSTFVVVNVVDTEVTYDVYRLNPDTMEYELVEVD